MAALSPKRARIEEEDEEMDEDDDSDDYSDDDEGEMVLEEHSATDAADGEYKFAFQRLGTCDFPSSHEKIDGQVFHRGGEGWKQVGTLKGNLIHRDMGCYQNELFHEVCDAESEELQGIAVTCCNADGTIRFKHLDGIDRALNLGADRGDFVQVEKVQLDAEHRGKGVGLLCFSALLDWQKKW